MTIALVVQSFSSLLSQLLPLEKASYPLFLISFQRGTPILSISFGELDRCNYPGNQYPSKDRTLPSPQKFPAVLFPVGSLSTPSLSSPSNDG